MKRKLKELKLDYTYPDKSNTEEIENLIASPTEPAEPNLIEVEGINIKFSSSNTNNISTNLIEDKISELELFLDKSFFGSGLLEFCEDLDAFQKLCISLLYLNSAMFSSVISIIYIFYGDYLLEKFNIEQKYPKLAKIILLRKKFQRYYLLLNISTIILIPFMEVVFCIAILIK
uniref:Uncharacterized protein n=1 Tax=Lyophyllum shimeji TaxID=47721 RepID=A0A2Z4HGY7_LYOSH|nr:hypothetical protein [Lyophyllum shimeji]AWW14107.1 hypothetical protein [Lyophyllum shimeji]